MNFMIYNLKERSLIFRPHIFRVRFFLPGEEETPQVKFFFSRSAIEKLIWFSGWLKKNGESAYIYLKKIKDLKTKSGFSINEGGFSMEAGDFPIADHVGLLKARKFLEKGLKRVDVVVFSPFEIKVMDPSLFDCFLENDCKATFHCFDQNLMDIEKPELLEIKAQVQMPLSC